MAEDINGAQVKAGDIVAIADERCGLRVGRVYKVISVSGRVVNGKAYGATYKLPFFAHRAIKILLPDLIDHEFVYGEIKHER